MQNNIKRNKREQKEMSRAHCSARFSPWAFPTNQRCSLLRGFQPLCLLSLSLSAAAFFPSVQFNSPYRGVSNPSVLCCCHLVVVRLGVCCAGILLPLSSFTTLAPYRVVWPGIPELEYPPPLSHLTVVGIAVVIVEGSAVALLLLLAPHRVALPRLLPLLTLYSSSSPLFLLLLALHPSSSSLPPPLHIALLLFFTPSSSSSSSRDTPPPPPLPPRPCPRLSLLCFLLILINPFSFLITVVVVVDYHRRLNHCRLGPGCPCGWKMYRNLPTSLSGGEGHGRREVRRWTR
jgi:hypothetical protein